MSKKTTISPFDVFWRKNKLSKHDEKMELFDNVQTNIFPILRSILRPESPDSQNYRLRPRVHHLQLPDHANHLADSNFIVRMLFKNVY